MKKLFNVFLFLGLAIFALAVVASPKVYAEDATEPAVTSKVVFHYAQFSEDYSDCGFHTWAFGGSEGRSFPVKADGTDSFGAYWEITVDAAAGDTMGMIFMKKGMDASSQWDNKSYARDLFFDTSILTAKGGAYDKVDVYYFENASKYFIAYPDRVNILVAYYDASGAYEENLGMHVWGGITGAEASGDFDPNGDAAVYQYSTVLYDGSSLEWGVPAKVFADGLASVGGTVGKVAMLYAPAGSTPGGLIYAGDDPSKKTTENLFDLTAEQATAGSLHTYYVTNREVFTENVPFFAKAFSFRLMDFSYVDDECDGTYAPNPNSIIVKMDSAVAITASTESYFTVNEVTLDGEGNVPVDAEGKPVVGAAVAVKQVDWDKADASSSEFVVQLLTALDNTKNYVIIYNEGAEGNYGFLKVAMDTNGPQIIVPTRAIDIVYGREFGFENWPTASIVITDDRGGQIMYYCVQGEESTLDTGKVGEQKVKIFAQDAWGNISTAYITFNVVAPAESGGGCSSGAVFAILGALVCASTALVVLRKRNA